MFKRLNPQTLEEDINGQLFNIETVGSAVIVTVVGEVSELPPIPERTPTLEEMQMQTLLNTEYLVIMSELTNL